MNTSVNNKILTKNTNRGFQIRKPQKTTAEQEKALREQLHAEIEIKTKACSNIVYDCSLPRVEGYEYCLKHILQDPKTPYKQCTYLYPSNGKRCTQPAPKYDPKKDIFTNFCFEHSRLTQITKTKLNIGKFKNVETNEALLKGLAHHVNVDANKSTSNSISYNDSGESDVDISRPYVDPYVDIEKIVKKETGRHILDYASDSSCDDEDISTVTNTWKGQDMDCSDNESVDSQSDDMLKHAGIYTTEEATMITKQKMMRLQVLYIDQIYRLQHLLKEKRRKYLQTLKMEKETLCSIHDQAKEVFDERQMYNKLKALNKFHRKNGIEAILHRKFIEKRARALDGNVPRTSFHSKCIYTEGGVKCGDRIIPCTKYCRKHILEDKKQVLYRSCEIEKSGVICREPVANIFENSTCVLHIELPTQRIYTQKKYESDSEEDEITGGPSVTSTSIVVKKEEVSFDQQQNQQKPLYHPSPSEQAFTSTASVMPSQLNEIIQGDDIEMFCSEDVGNNVTICHEQEDTSLEENQLRLSDSETGSSHSMLSNAHCE